MTTEYDPDVHRTALTDQNGNPLPIAYDPAANGGDGGFVILDASDIKEIDGEVTLENFNDLAQEATLDAFKTDFDNEDFASETTLAEIRDQQDLADNEVVNAKVSFADTAGAGDTKTVAIPAPVDPQKGEMYMIYAYNGSDATTITVDKETTFTDSDNIERTISHNLFENLATETADSMPEEIVFMHEGADLVIINDTALSTDDAYDVYVRVVKL